MQMAEDWKLYWDKTSSDGYGTEIYFSRVNDGTEEEYIKYDIENKLKELNKTN